MEKSVGIYTLGCKVNQYESEAVAELFGERGFKVCDHSLPCDIYVINTCTVTSESDRKARQFIRRAISANPDAYILVMGCMAQRVPDEIAKIGGVDYICGSSNKLSVVEAAEKLLEAGRKNVLPQKNVTSLDGADFEAMRISRFDRTRAYLKIEDGCENNCTYCAIPSARGKVRSKKPTDVLREVRLLTENGCREIVLTGIETASYGNDLDGYGFADLLCDIDRIEGVGRVRIGSIDPSVMREDFVKKIAELRCLAPHFHISMQSGSNKILAAMKRKYNREIALRNMELLRKYIKDVNFTTDIIVGFPGETDEDFRDTVDLAEKAKFLAIHVFSYSKRAGTPAAAMKDQVPEAVKHARSAELIAVSKRLTAEILEKFISENEKVSVLFESHESGYAYGHTPSFVEVRAKSDVPLHGEIREVKPLSFSDGTVTGEITED